jgi:ECF sigma factor
MSEGSGQISELLQQWVKGDQEALDAVAPVIYQELRRLARHRRAASRSPRWRMTGWDSA